MVKTVTQIVHELNWFQGLLENFSIRPKQNHLHSLNTQHTAKSQHGTEEAS